MTLLATLLMVGLLYALYLMLFMQHRRLLAWGVGVFDYDKTVLPSIPFVNEDFAALSDLIGDKGRIRGKSADFTIRESSSIKETIRDLEDKLAAVQDVDVVILYLRAHGIAEPSGTAGAPAKATFAGSDFFRVKQGQGTAKQDGLVEVSLLLKAVQNCRAAVKLVLVDAVHLGSDPRLGMLVNRFPELLAAEVKNTDDPNLWVLSSTSLLEFSKPARPAANTIFGRAVAQGLAGKANELALKTVDQDPDIRLAPLYKYVLKRCSEETDGNQTPVLMNGKQGVIETLKNIPEDLIVASLEPVAPSGDSKSDTPQKETGPKDGKENKTPSVDKPAEKKQAWRRLPRTTLAMVSLATEPANPAASGQADTAPTLAQGEVQAQTKAVGEQGAEAPATPPPQDAAAGSPAAGAGAPPAGSSVKPADPAAPAKSDAPQPAATDKAAPAVTDKAATEKAAAAKVAAEKGAAEKREAEQREAEKPEVEQVGAEAAKAGALKAVREAWRLRDKLADRNLGKNRCSAIDFAPCYWRELNARILAYEQRCNSGTAYVDEEFPKEELAKLKDLLAWMAAGEAANAAQERRSESTIADHMQQAWQQFQTQFAANESKDEARDTEASELSETFRARFTDLMGRVTWYVQWHDRASFTQYGGTLPQFDAIENLLDELIRFCGDLEKLAGKGDISRGSFRDLLSRLNDIDQVRERLEDSLWQDCTQAMNEPGRPMNRQIIEDHLSTPLWSAERREQLISKLFQPLKEGSITEKGNPQAIEWQGKAAQWQRLHERSRLNAKLLWLADAKLADPVLRAVNEAKPDELDPAKRIELYHKIGGLLPPIWQSFPGQICKSAQAAQGGDAVAKLGLFRKVHIVDPRDVRLLQCEFVFSRLPFQIEQRPATIRFSDPRPSELVLAADKWTRLVTAVEASPGRLEDEDRTPSVACEFDAEKLEVRLIGAEKLLASGDQLPVPMKKGVTPRASMELEVRWRGEAAAASAARRTDLNLVLIGREQPPPRKTVTCRMPSPHLVELVIAPPAAGTQTTVRRKERLDGTRTADFKLRPFPNRKTAFQFQMINRSGRPMDVLVQLAAVNRPASADWTPGLLLDDDAGGRRPGLERELFGDDKRFLREVRILAQTKGPQKLDASETPRTIAFVSPAEAAAPAAKPTDKPAAATADKPAASEPAPDVTSGLVCLISTTTEPKEQWVYWVELTPQSPRDFLDASARYDFDDAAKQGQLTVNVRPKSKADMPADWEKIPVHVVWDGLDAIGAEGTQDKDDVASGQDAKLYAQVKDVGTPRKVMVNLAVDDYPRGFVFEVEFAEISRNPKNTRGEESRVAIRAISGADSNTVFHRDDPRLEFVQAQAAAAAAAASPGAKVLTHVPLDRNKVKSAAFKAPCKFVEVELAIDAPDDAFQKPDDAITVSLDDLAKAQQRKLYSDRQVAISLAGIDPEGVLTLASSVGDHRVQFPTAGLLDQEVTVKAELRVTTLLRNPDPVSEEIILDNKPPEITLQVPSQQEIGNPVTAQMKLLMKDRSGIDQVKFGFDKNGDGKLGPDDEALSGIEGNGAWTARLETAELKPKTMSVLVEAVDRVGIKATRKAAVELFIPRPRMPSTVTQKGSAPPAAPKPGTILGRVVFQGEPVPANRIEVVLKGTSRKVDAGAGGMFRFDNVKPGTYTLKASGSVSNVSREGELPGVQPKPPGDDSPPVELEVK